LIRSSNKAILSFIRPANRGWHPHGAGLEGEASLQQY
jgi:hypothetical protein